MKKIAPNIILETCETFFIIREYETTLPYLNELLEYYRYSSTQDKEQVLFYLDNLIKNVSEIIAAEIDKNGSEIHPSEPLVWFNTACIHTLLGKPTQAREALEKAITLNPLMKEMAKDEKILKGIYNNDK